jgi:transcriptional regulator with XRE-family HTH domain
MRLDHERVRWHRDRLGWTLDTLAEKAEVAKGTVLRAEHGEDVRPSSGRRIARALGVEISDLIPDKPRRVGEPAFAEKGEASTTGRPRMTAKRALEIADSDSVRREAEGASVEELQQTALELAQFTKPQTREELFKRHKDDKKAQLKEAHQRTMAKTAILAVNEELDHRGAPSPVELVARVFDEAMNPPEETPRLDREEQKGKEAG